MLGVFLDTETNGLNPFIHRTLEIAFKIVDVLTGKEIASYEAIIYATLDEWALSDKASLNVNGFTYTQVQAGKAQEVVAAEVKSIFKKYNIQRGSSVFICQNPSFDRMFFARLISPEKQEALNWPYHWLDLASMYWVVALKNGEKDPQLYPWVTGISKNKIAIAYNLPPEESPHRAINGVDHLITCYKIVTKSFL